jgi:very-short-patch-repair endonuclease
MTFAYRPPELRDAPFLGSAAIGAGLLTCAQLRSSAWRRLFRDVYVDATLPDTHLLRINAAALRLPPGAVISGRSAAHLWGAELAGAADPVEILTPTNFGRVDGMRIRSGALSAEEATIYRGVPVCTAMHAIWEIARALPTLSAIGWVDALARASGFATADVAGHAERHRGERDSRRATTTMRLCDPRAESVPESKVRVSLMLGGLPAPVPQFTVRYPDGSHLARVDLAWPRWRFAVEYDGLWHGERNQLDRDRRRIRNLNAAGWYVYPVTRADLRDINRLVRDVAAALDRAAAR